MSVASVDQNSVADYIEGERREANDELAAFLIANSLQRVQWRLRVKDRVPMEVISRAVTDIKPDLVVLRRYGRSRLLEVLIDNVTNDALRTLNIDHLVVLPFGR